MRKPIQFCTQVKRTLAAFIALAVLSAPLHAQQGACGERGGIVKQLASKYDETVTARALGANGSVLEVYAAPGGSWTMLMTYPGGPTCVMQSGQGWQTLNPAQAKPDVRAMMRGRRKRHA